MTTETVDCHSACCTTALLNVKVTFILTNTKCFSCCIAVRCFCLYDVFSPTAVSSRNQYIAAIFWIYYRTFSIQGLHEGIINRAGYSSKITGTVTVNELIPERYFFQYRFYEIHLTKRNYITVQIFFFFV